MIFGDVLAIQLKLVFRESASLDFSALVGEAEKFGFKLGAGQTNEHARESVYFKHEFKMITKLYNRRSNKLLEF